MAIEKVQSINTKVLEYDRLRAEAKKIKSRMDVLAKEIKDYAALNGTKDDKGSFYAENAQFVYGSQCKKSVSLNPDRTLKYFKDHGLTDYIETKEYVREEVVEGLNSDGTISYEDLESLCDMKTTYSISVVKKEEVTAQVEEHEVLPMAASKKPKPKLKARKK